MFAALRREVGASKYPGTFYYPIKFSLFILLHDGKTCGILLRYETAPRRPLRDYPPNPDAQRINNTTSESMATYFAIF